MWGQYGFFSSYFYQISSQYSIHSYLTHIIVHTIRLSFFYLKIYIGIKIMCIFFLALQDISALTVLLNYYTFFQVFLLNLTPPIIGGMMSTQANLLKVELYNRLLEEQGKLRTTRTSSISLRCD